ncbi:MAG: hypothetical protein KA022_01480 [Candidatus Omnitrophica bacterium]|jgi:hypothetical protein|nr:hypothetical protein [Candidatus Omnitrophota bacterium]
MDWLRLLQKAIYFISTLGILVGLDLLLGAKIISNSKKFLDKTILDVDRIIVKISSLFRKTVDTRIDIDQKIISPKARIIAGLLLITISVAMIFFARKI